MRIVRLSDELRVTVARIESGEDGSERPRRKATRSTAQTPETGTCIRCGESIAANAAQPYCSRCYRSWNQYKNDDYEEKHCHICGNGHKATKRKPVHPACYRKHKSWVDSTIK